MRTTGGREKYVSYLAIERLLRLVAGYKNELAMINNCVCQ